MRFLKQYKTGVFAIALASLGLTSCLNDLDVQPIDPDVTTPNNVYTSEAAFESVLAKCYSGLAVSGTKGPAGDPDLSRGDEGHGEYWRGYFYLSELTTDEAICGWDDGDLSDLSKNSWDAGCDKIEPFYNRAFYQISLANEFLRQANTYGKDSYINLPRYRAEARFLRVFSYWHALDLFGNGIPFADETSAIGSVGPLPAGVVGGPEVFNYIEKELLSIIDDSNAEHLVDPQAGVIGQATKGAAWMLLAKLYLNNEVYLDATNNNDPSAYYKKAKIYVDKVINEGGYSLVEGTVGSPLSSKYSDYQCLFLADNYKCSDEFIFTINFDGMYAQSFGGSTYLVNAAISGDMKAADYGTNSGWGGNRVLRELVNKFPNTDPTQTADQRDLWFTSGQTLDIVNFNNFQDGYACPKFVNMDREGNPGSNAAAGQADVNIPVFRLADAYLMQAEIDLRLGSLSDAAFQNFNKVRTRAKAAPMTKGEIDLDVILNERARELYWEGHRRTDLVRFNKYTGGSYVWQFKGGVTDGTSIDEYYRLMPIPSTDLNANPKLKQNPGYSK
ncbi:RagB/SusD family nutrient uptake outer membrane protein [Halosquirtibacter laminarini]|uniref:RagB/SusD family nutrient uptake outer membrane protein n=1 Tax=Halosquirtibacter laminarini TaxID=3374600 RepID=A0AC61NMT4_9BACT|nr:RagB/SusD family nutrient uptake outer membrane protein [Prolixibacteraceae bacterium]